MEQHPLAGLAQLALKAIIAFQLFFLVAVYVLPSFVATRSMLIASFVGIVALLLAASSLIEATVDPHSLRWIRFFGYAFALFGVQLGVIVGQSFSRVGGPLSATLSVATAVLLLIAVGRVFRLWSMWR